jgi:hypothetical protein
MKAVLWLMISLASSAALAQGASTFDPAQEERQIMAVLDAFMNAFNARDAAAEERTYHFPHYRLAGGDMRVLEGPGADTQALMNATYKQFESFGWRRSAWTRRKIVHLSADKAHVDAQFTRYRGDAAVIGAYDSLYVLTKEQGRWGIKLRSSFAQ